MRCSRLRLHWAMNHPFSTAIRRQFLRFCMVVKLVWLSKDHRIKVGNHFAWTKV